MKFSVLSNLVLALTVPSMFGVFLYRNGGADKPYNQVRTPQDYNNPVNGIVPPDPCKGMSMNSDQNALLNPVKVWRIDSAALTMCNLKPVNDEDTHYSITLTKSTPIDQLLKDINSAAGWAKIT